MARLIIIILFLSVCNLYSQNTEPINPDRPDQSNSPSVLPIRSLQFENGIQYESQKFEGDSKISTETIPDVLIRYGLFKNAELRVDVQYLHQTFKSGMSELELNGMSPLSIGTKIKISEEKGIRPAIGFQFDITIPKTGAQAFQTEYTAPEFRLLMQNTISKKLSVSYNLGETWDGFTARPSTLYTVSLGIEVNKKIGLFIEPYGFLTSGEKPDHRFDAGLTYLIRNNLQSDISAGVGLTSVSPDFFIGAGFSFRLPR